jgi:hypothetical protein
MQRIPVDVTQIPILRENLPTVLASLAGNTLPTFAPPTTSPSAPSVPSTTDSTAPQLVTR